MLRKMVIPGEKIVEVESEDTDDAASIAGEPSTGRLELDFNPILSLMEKLNRKRIENLFIKVSKVKE